MMIKLDRRLTRRLTLHLFFATLFLLFALNVARADELAVWNFNDSDLNVDHGSGTLSHNLNAVNVLFAAGSATNARLGDLAGTALSLQGGTSNANNGRNITINVSTVGFADIVVTFATQGTSTGFTSNQFQYSLDGTNFIDFGTPYVPATTFGAIPIVFTLSSIAGLNNNANAAFRIVFNGATSSTGNNRIDNLVVEGTGITTVTVPEPATMTLLISGLPILYAAKRKRRVAAK
ncbi:MAG TPA: PEP-CTERM sorting domain-containing protein [Pyrinomonadaceae bacterium]|nr:PEP-CTERM sorting domain-containing protein [Pyrinomonadaceae bacterium]